jgi:hypothetical protein
VHGLVQGLQGAEPGGLDLTEQLGDSRVTQWQHRGTGLGARDDLADVMGNEVVQVQREPQPLLCLRSGDGPRSLGGRPPQVPRRHPSSERGHQPGCARGYRAQGWFARQEALDPQR